MHEEKGPTLSNLIDIENTRRLTREEAAAWLRQLADSLSRHNQLEFDREGMRYTVEVTDEVELEVELEIGDGGGELEIELRWP